MLRYVVGTYSSLLLPGFFHQWAVISGIICSCCFKKILNLTPKTDQKTIYHQKHDTVNHYQAWLKKKLQDYVAYNPFQGIISVIPRHIWKAILRENGKELKMGKNFILVWLNKIISTTNPKYLKMSVTFLDNTKQWLIHAIFLISSNIVSIVSLSFVSIGLMTKEVIYCILRKAHLTSTTYSQQHL